MANRGALVLCLGLGALAACGVGDDGPPSTPEPRLCQAHMSLTGSFTLGQAPPDHVNNDTGNAPGDGLPDIMGCWPVGTWAFSVSITDNTCAVAPTPLAEYKFTTTFVDDPVEPDYTYAVVTPSPATTKSRVSVSSDAAGCQGTIELFSEDGKQTWNLQPSLTAFNTNGPLTGSGEYAEWKDAQTYP
ncbi:MAG: hypothetical protein IPQ07_03550 [Myxococcales bacterium]|nr:hypothetical protein [Myxococcales bacterium]